MENFLYTVQEKQLSDKVHAFTLTDIMPKIQEYDENAIYPTDIMKNAVREDIMLRTIPEEYGGIGGGLMEGYIVSEELAWGCAGVAAAMLVQEASVMQLCLASQKKLKEKYFEKIRHGDWMTLAFTEPDAGSHITAITTEARRQGDTYVLNGSKTLISGVGKVKYALVFAKLPDEGKGAFSMFVVDLESSGVTIHKPFATMGQRANIVGSFDLNNVTVGKEERVFEEDGLIIALKGLEYNRICCAGIAMGIARRALDEVVEYVKKRSSYGKKIWEHQAVGQMIANMDVQIQAAKALNFCAVKNTEKNGNSGKLSSHAKVFATDAAMEICSDAVQIFGGIGYLKGNPVEKLYRDVKACQIYEGTSQIQRDIIVRAIMKRG